MKIKWFTLLVMLYLIIATGWWTLLLFEKNNTEFIAKIELAKVQNINEIDTINEKYNKQKKMIIGESLFLGLSLLAGIWLIYRGNDKEIKSINNQNNFLLAVTHEFKTPLSSVNLILETIKNRNLDPNQLKSLSITGIEEVQRLESMIQNLLLSSSDQNESDHSTYAEIELNDLIVELLLHFRKSHPGKELNYENKSLESLKIAGDRAHISMAIKNVIENALKYGSDEKVKISLHKKNQKASIKISDTGIGINDQNKALIFKRFYRVQNELTRDYQGTGIGLYLSKKIIEAHKGDISVEDNKPKGSTFIINLPIYES